MLVAVLVPVLVIAAACGLERLERQVLDPEAGQRRPARAAARVATPIRPAAPAPVPEPAGTPEWATAS